MLVMSSSVLPSTSRSTPTAKVLPSNVRLASSSMVLPDPTIGILLLVKELMCTVSLKVDTPVILRSVKDAASPGTATPLIPVYLAPLTYILFPDIPAGRLVPIK